VLIEYVNHEYDKLCEIKLFIS